MSAILSVVIMAVMALIGFFVGIFVDDAMGGSILFAIISGIACVIHTMNHKAD